MQRKAAHTSGRRDCSHPGWAFYFMSFSCDLLAGSMQFVLPPVRSTRRAIENCGSQSTSGLLIHQRFLLKVRFQIKSQFYPNEVGQAARCAMSSNQLFESILRAERIFETVQHSSTGAFREFRSCVAINDNAVVCDCDRIGKRSIATVG